MKVIQFLFLAFLVSCGSFGAKHRDEETLSPIDRVGSWQGQDISSEQNKRNCEPYWRKDRMIEALSYLENDMSNLFVPYSIREIFNSGDRGSCLELVELSLNQLISNEKLRNIDVLALYKASRDIHSFYERE